MKAALLATAMLIASPALADDGAYCRQQAADMLEIGKILIDDMKDDKPEITQWRLRALVLLCMAGSRTAEPSYEVKLSPPTAKKVAAKKPDPDWLKSCKKFISYDPKSGTVVTNASAPKRVPCPKKPKE